MEENNFQPEQKRGRGRPRKLPGEPKTHYKSRVTGCNPLSSAHSYVEFLPDKSLEICEEHLNAFFSTMLERQLMWKRRFIDKKPQPWTGDEIFRENRFTNVYRELDRSSQFVIKKIILANKDASLNNIVWKILVYRLFNNPDTFELASFIWPGGIPDYENFDEQKEKYFSFIELIQKNGINPFTNAYFISSSFAKGIQRVEAYTQIVLPKLWENINRILDICLLAENPKDIINALQTIPGVKDFIANELYTDLLYVNKYTSRALIPFDVNANTNVGPGSLLGIRLIYPNIESREQQIAKMHELLSIAENKLKAISIDNLEKMPYALYDSKKQEWVITDTFNLDISNIEGWLCEYSKYWKMSIEQGRKQRKFKPISENDSYETKE